MKESCIALPFHVLPVAPFHLFVLNKVAKFTAYFPRCRRASRRRWMLPAIRLLSHPSTNSPEVVVAEPFEPLIIYCPFDALARHIGLDQWPLMVQRRAKRYSSAFSPLCENAVVGGTRDSIRSTRSVGRVWNNVGIPLSKDNNARESNSMEHWKW